MLYHPKVLVIIMPMKYQDLVVLKLKVPQMTMNQNIYPIMMIILHVLDPNMTVPQICHCPSLNQEKDLRGAEVRRVLVSLLVRIGKRRREDQKELNRPPLARHHCAHLHLQPPPFLSREMSNLNASVAHKSKTLMGKASQQLLYSVWCVICISMRLVLTMT